MVLRRCFKVDEEAVSEVVGSILTLAITVVLFSSVFATVTQLEGPDEKYHVELQSNLDYHDSVHYVNVSHEGGKDLSTSGLRFTILIDGVTSTYDFEHPNVTLVGDDKSTWSIGEQLSIKDRYELDLNSTMELVVQDKDTNRVVYKTVILDRGREVFDIQNSHIRYEEAWRDYAKSGEEIEIRTEVTASVFKRNESFDPEDVWVNASLYKDDLLLDEDGNTISSDEDITLTHLNSGKYNRTLSLNPGVNHTSYRVKITAESGDASLELNTEPRYIYLNVGKEAVQYYEEELVFGDIWFRPGSPSHGDNFTIYAEVFNEGNVNKEANWTVTDDKQGNFSGTINVEKGPSPTVIKATYPDNILTHGPHEVELKVTPSGDWTGDSWIETIHVDPSIMLVGDSIPDEIDETKLMENALKGLNLDYDKYSVDLGETIPNLEDKLPDYSITIWMTGNRTENTNDLYINEDGVLTTLDDYIEGKLVGSGSMNGTFWMIGSNLDKINGGDFGQLGDKLGVESLGTSQTIDTKKDLFAPNKNETSTYGDYTYGIDEGEYIEINSLKDGVKFNNTLVEKEESPDHYFGVGYEKNYTDNNYTHRTAVNSLLFGSIADPGLRNIMAGEVIEWVSNVTARTGVDIAVASQSIQPTAPMYRDEVKINATLRNNGPEDLYVKVRAVKDRGEDVLTPDDREEVYLPGEGGTNTTTFTWRADELGEHEFVVKADYFDEIDEVNERNNDIRYKNLDITTDKIKVNVEFSTLVVDADGSESYAYSDVGGEIKQSFDRLGQVEGRDYDYIQVEPGDDGPDYENMMEDYNSMYWITGDRPGNNDLFTTNDVDNILDYLEQDSGANMLFMGENILDYLTGNNNLAVDDRDKLINYLGIDPADSVGDDVESEVIIGQKDTNLGHNLKYKIEDQIYDGFESLNESGKVLFKNGDGENIASTYDDGSTKTVYMGVNLNNIQGPLLQRSDFEDWPVGDVATGEENAQDEFVYTSIWNFGKQDNRVELRVTDYDIKFSSQNPQTSRSYYIDVKIENIGYSSIPALVRVKDEDNHIATRTVVVGPTERESKPQNTHFEVDAGSATIEVPWRPNYGGMRSIKVRVDPLDQRKEIQNETGEEIMEFHNQAIIEHPVYYFYDDMENGEGKWRYDSTLMNIDGSSSLDFIGREGLDTNVNESWDTDLSGSTSADGKYYMNRNGIHETDNPAIRNFTDNASYSPPRSYWMPETPGDPEVRGRKPIDLVLVIDRSDTQTAEELEDVKDAAKAAVDLLKEGDRVAIFLHGSGSSIDDALRLDNPDSNISDESDKTTIKQDYIDPISIQSQNTALFDTLSWAVYHIESERPWSREDSVKGIISLGDGVSNRDASKDNDDRFNYAPGGSPGDEPNEDGPVRWYKQGESSGLLGIPYNIMTISTSERVEARMHSISATSTGEKSFGIIENNSKKLEDVFTMFVSELQKTTRGDLKSIDPLEPSGTEPTSSLTSSNTVKNTDFVVYSDGFTAGIDNDLANEYFVPGYDNYSDATFDFTYKESGEKGGNKDDLYWHGKKIFAESNTKGDIISNIVRPKSTLEELNGSYEVEGAYVNFQLYTPEADESGPSDTPPNSGGSLGLKLTINGQTKTVFEHFTEPYQDEGSGETGYYHSREISEYISGSDPFEFEFIDDGASSSAKKEPRLQLDDISFTYEINFYPEEQEYIQNIAQNRTYRYLTTPSADLGDIENLNSATLQFRHKYKAPQGASGGFLYLWGNDGGEWNWEKDKRLYIEPEQSYTGNLNLERVEERRNTGGVNITGENDGLIDANDNLPYWVFNGKSKERTFGWRYTQVELTRYKDFIEEFDEIKAVFTYAQLGGITREQGWQPEMGWYIDNVKFKVSSDWARDGPNYWNLVNASDLNEMGITVDESNENYHDHTYGNEDGHYWIFTSEAGGKDVLPKGVDSSLYTQPIYLTNAEDPRLTAHMKFNIDDGAGLPPDGFRVEVSADNGRSWDSITYGARSGWNASGTDDPGSDGNSYSGISDDGEYGWIDSKTLYRLNADLSGWRGESIILRFRVFTNTSEEYDESDLPKAIFLDDVMVTEGDMETGDDNLMSKDKTTNKNGRKTTESSPSRHEIFELRTQIPSFARQIMSSHLAPRNVMPVFDTKIAPTKKIF